MAMATPPTAPAAQPVRLRGNYAAAGSDFTLQQRWQDYNEEEHDIWRTLYGRQLALVERYGAPEVLAGLTALGAEPMHIPDFNAVNQRLRGATGWQIVAVPGLIPEAQFFAHLAARSFPVSVWIRDRQEMDYLAEPDLFHDFFGHVPLLVNPTFARFMQAYGEAGPKALAHDAVHLLARVYWYTVEFGLIRTSAGLRAYGAGILSSKGETVYSVTSLKAQRMAFDLERVMRTEYRIDDFQLSYFVIDSFEQLFTAGYGTDFAPLYERVRAQPSIAPGDLLPGEASMNSALIAVSSARQG
jgi:phenylalanine-4-hydroxylase